MTPPPRRANQAECDHAKPEIDDQAEINLEKVVPGYWRQRGHKNVVSRVAQQNGEQ